MAAIKIGISRIMNCIKMITITREDDIKKVPKKKERHTKREKDR